MPIKLIDLNIIERCGENIIVPFAKCSKTGIHLVFVFMWTGEIRLFVYESFVKFCELESYKGYDKDKYFEKARKLILEHQDVIKKYCDDELYGITILKQKD